MSIHLTIYASITSCHVVGHSRTHCHQKTARQTS